MRHVVVDDLALGEPRLGIEDLLQVGQLELPPLDLDEGHPSAPARFALAAASDASRAAMRSTTLAGSSTAGWATISWPSAFCSISGQHPVAVLVAVLLRLEVGRQRLDQLPGHLQLPVRHLGVGAGQAVERLGRHDLVGEEQRLEAQHVAHRPDGGQVLLGPQHQPGDGHLVGVLHRLEEQRVGLRRPLLRHQVVGPLVVDRVDLVEVDEVLDVDRPGGLGVERLELLRGDDHVPVGRDLEALDDLLVGHLLAGLGRHPLLADAGARPLLQLVEPHVLGGDGAEQLHRHVDQPEADGTAPDRSRHCLMLPLPCTTSLGSLSSRWPL